MADNRNTLTDEILVLAETLGDIKARFERVESEFAIQSRPLEAALAALSAAMTGIKTLQHHVLDNSLSALSLKVEEQRKAIDDQINVIVGELKGADAQNSEKIALQTAELKQQFAEICANVQQLSSQFDAQIKRVELEAKEQITKFAAVTGPQGPAGASFNPKGNWQEGVFYQRLDVVSLLGTSYVSNVDNNASKPTKNSDKWTVLAARAANVGGGGAGNFASLAGIAEVSQGGTGITQYAIGDILYANDTGSLARLPAGVNGQFLKTTGAGGAPEWETPTGGGDVVGPASATDNALVRFDGTSGTAIQNSNATLTDAGALTLASTINVTDTILGSSGPSVKSTLSARAPRQGLVYDGTTNSSATLTSAIGTSDFTVSVPFTVPASNPSGARGIFSIGNFGNGQTFCAYIGTNGALDIVLFGTTGGDYRASGVLGFVSANAGKTGLLTITRSSTTLTVYFNGVSQTLVAPTVGGVDPTWAGTLTSTSVRHGNMSTILYFYVGYVGDLDLYNRALSASEVVALYEAGAPNPADIGYVSGISPAAWAAGFSSPTVTSSSGSSVTATGQYGASFSTLLGTVGAVPVTVVIDVTASNITSAKAYFANSAADSSGVAISSVITLNQGRNVINLKRSSSATTYLCVEIAGGATTWTFTGTNITVGRGLLLAPDAAQAGGGLTWYDTSGNAANITLPASGVSWNVPTSGNIAANANQNVTITTSGTGRLVVPKESTTATDYTAIFGASLGSSTGSNRVKVGLGNVDGNSEISLGQSGTANVLLGWMYNATAGDAYGFLGSYAGNNKFVLQQDGGNVLIGTTYDGGYKLRVNGSIASDDVITMLKSGGNSTAVDGNFGQVIARTNSGNIGFACALANNTDVGGFIIATPSQNRTAAFLGTNGSAVIQTNGGTTALTLDSSQNATFEKTVGSALGFRGTKSVVVSSDTTVEIAADSGLGGIYQITVSGSNRVQRVLVSVAAQQYDNAKISVLSNYTYGGQAVLSNFRVTSNAGNTVRALICDVGNRNGASVTVSASAMFDTNGSLTLLSPSTYTTAVTTGYPMSVASGPSASDLTLGGNLTVSGTQNVLGLPASASALSTNSTMTFELTSNTSLTIKVRGTDGTTRSVALTLA